LHSSYLWSGAVCFKHPSSLVTNITEVIASSELGQKSDLSGE